MVTADDAYQRYVAQVHSSGAVVGFVRYIGIGGQQLAVDIGLADLGIGVEGVVVGLFAGKGDTRTSDGLVLAGVLVAECASGAGGVHLAFITADDAHQRHIAQVRGGGAVIGLVRHIGVGSQHLAVDVRLADLGAGIEAVVVGFFASQGNTRAADGFALPGVLVAERASGAGGIHLAFITRDHPHQCDVAEVRGGAAVVGLVGHIGVGGQHLTVDLPDVAAHAGGVDLIAIDLDGAVGGFGHLDIVDGDLLARTGILVGVVGIAKGKHVDGIAIDSTTHGEIGVADAGGGIAVVGLAHLALQLDFHLGRIGVEMAVARA